MSAFSNNVYGGFYGNSVRFLIDGSSQLTAPCSCTDFPGDSLDTKYVHHSDDTKDFLETSRVLQGYLSDFPPPFLLVV